MLGTMAVLSLVALATATATDTTLTVQSGTRLTLSQFAGSIEVQTWDRNAVRVVADHGPRVEIEIRRSGSSLAVETEHRHGIPVSVDYRLTVPKWMALQLSGVNTDISVGDSEGELELETVQGQVTVTGGSKSVNASSVDGEVLVRGATGRIECSSVNGGVRVERSSGPVVASSINGEIVLDAIRSGDVEASTVNGGVTYQGSIQDGGVYRFSTHNGDLVVVLPERAGARVSVATFSGNFSSDFPVELREAQRGKEFEFTFGNGGARIELESFQGEIRLRRPGGRER